MARFYILKLIFRAKHLGGYTMEKMTKEEIMERATVINGVAFVNATPHALNIVQRDGAVLTIEPSGICPRCSSTEVIDQAIGLIDITKQTLGEVEGLPEEIPGVFFVVSRLVASAAGRNDLLVPGQGIRDDQGRIIGCKGLSRL